MLSVNGETQEEVDGAVGEAVGRGKNDRGGWIKEKYGLSWQIIPNALGRLMGDKNAAKAQSVAKAMLQMDKIDTARLEQAHDQA